MIKQLPSVKNAYTIDNVTIILVFDEPVDSLKGATIANYSIDGGLTFNQQLLFLRLFNKVQLKLTYRNAGKYSLYYHRQQCYRL